MRRDWSFDANLCRTCDHCGYARIHCIFILRLCVVYIVRRRVFVFFAVWICSATYFVFFFSFANLDRYLRESRWTKLWGGCGGTGVLMRTFSGRAIILGWFAIIVGGQGSIVIISFVFVLFAPATLYEESSSFWLSKFSVTASRKMCSWRLLS